MDKILQKIIVICGPTGSGKTSLAVSLCKKFNGEIINADSRQVYKGMDIGTGKEEVKSEKSLQSGGQVKVKSFGVPAAQYLEGIRIHLVDILEPNERYTVGQFKKDAEEAIEDILRRSKVPFVVGGTGLYIDALTENFSLPSELKVKSGKLKVKDKNIEELVEILKDLDPKALDIVDLKNRRRVERAVEVCLNSGIPFSQQRTRGERKYEVLKLAPEVSQNREKLYEKINKRVDEMIKQGLEKEVLGLVEKYGWESEAMTGIGYKEWRTFFVNDKLQITNDKQITNEIQDIVDQIKQDTRKYAKRQMTWFKRDKKIQYVDLKNAEKLVKVFLTKK